MFVLTLCVWVNVGTSFLSPKLERSEPPCSDDGTVKTVTLKRNALAELFVYFALELADYPQIKLMTRKAALNMM